MEEKQKLILGGVFATHTEMDADGNITRKDDFHLRLYWELFHSGAIKKLKGAKLHVLLAIAMHADQRAEGWPSIDRLTDMLPYGKNSINQAIQALEEDGFIEREQQRGQAGKFGNMKYRIRYGVPDDQNTVSQKGGYGENPQEISVSTVSQKAGDRKTGTRKVGYKEDAFNKKDLKDDNIKTINKDDQRAREAISLDDLDLSYLPDSYPAEIREVVEKRPELFPNVGQALKITERIRWAHGKAAKQIGYEIPHDYKLSAQVLREVIVRYALGKIEKDWIGYYHNALTDRLFAKALEGERQADRQQQAADFHHYNWVKGGTNQ